MRKALCVVWVHALEYTEDGKIYYGIPTERPIHGQPIRIRDLFGRDQVSPPQLMPTCAHARAAASGAAVSARR
jgi:hypothetical protein